MCLIGVIHGHPMKKWLKYMFDWICVNITNMEHICLWNFDVMCLICAIHGHSIKKWLEIYV